MESQSKKQSIANDADATRIPDDEFDTVQPPNERAFTNCDEPESIGRYRVDKRLGRGGFGTVYRAYDAELRRYVAIKVPRLERIQNPGDVDIYLEEARAVASLDHPGIVPVYDFGRTDDGYCFVVSKLIDGSDLATVMRRRPIGQERSLEIVASVAEALHHAHNHGLVHRDVKPQNILIDSRGRAYITDFGSVLKEEDVGKDGGRPFTPAYMSPELARCEGHRVDGRSDTYSLGVVFYKLLTGRLPFEGNPRDVVMRIAHEEVCPPRMRKDTIPAELERICLKALSNKLADRYTTALDMANELRQWHTDSQSPITPTTQPQQPSAEVEETREMAPARVIPKGLLSFDESDSAFFLDLVPGPRGRDGLPESIRFWKKRVEDTDPDNTFCVGLIYGPTGSGKSSLVKAGVLPRLAGHVVPVYVEASAQDTESNLQRRIRKNCPDLPPALDLLQTMETLRRRTDTRKVAIILDQFEQWLHATPEHKQKHSKLVRSLRQCDGKHLQCVILVRDDFWMAATRFMQLLEVRQVEGHNVACVDRFEPVHASDVLIKFGQAYGRLPENVGDMTDEQRAFVDQVIAGLGEDGKVICVRLAILAQMVKDKPWTVVTLKEIGGTSGVGVNFLEETFCSETALPEHRLHQRAAQAVLASLLPSSGSSIKGQRRSRAELMRASQYGRHRSRFDELLWILDSETRLITPVDSEQGDGETTEGSGERYYQLTHDFLVPSLRDWLYGKERETFRGRAKLRLAERTSAWNATRRNRDLPAWWEFINIHLLTRKKNWTKKQRNMMSRAARYHGLWSFVSAALFVGLMFASHIAWGRVLADRLLEADIDNVPKIIQMIDTFGGWAERPLQATYRTSSDPERKLRASLALFPGSAEDHHQLFLYERMLSARPDELPVIRDRLAPNRLEIEDQLWRVLQDRKPDERGRRLRAACALASYSPESERWQQVSADVARQLVLAPSPSLSTWIGNLRPIAPKLIEHLNNIARSSDDVSSARMLAVDVLLDYASEQDSVLVGLLIDADHNVFSRVFAALEERDAANSLLKQIVEQPPDTNAAADEQDIQIKRQANAAVALTRMDMADDVWPLLKHAVDNSLRSELIHRFHSMGVVASVIARRLDKEKDSSIRRALISSLAQYSPGDFSADDREAMVKKLASWYQNDPDPGIHGAVEWILRVCWNEGEMLGQLKQSLCEDERSLSQRSSRDARRWYVNGQGQTMTILEAKSLQMGSPESEPGRQTDEEIRVVEIERTFAIASTEVTKEQFRRFQQERPDINRYEIDRFSVGDDHPQLGMDWYDATAYCNWLSEKEGIPEDQRCYIPAPGRQFREGMKPAPDYLTRTGYRLPSEAEWEFACRSDTTTSRFYGRSDELLPRYCWYLNNSQDQSWPVGRLKPNDFGLFDMYGNAFEWCQERYVDRGSSNTTILRSLFTQSHHDREDRATVSDTDRRVLRGGSFDSRAHYLRSAHRTWAQPATRYNHFGFRVARTVPR